MSKSARGSRMSRCWRRFVGVVLLIATGFFASPGLSQADNHSLASLPPRTGYPNSMSATGDSITRAVDARGYGEYPELSWSTGTDTTVNSLYRRILVANPAINGNNNNAAVSGARMSALQGQMSTVNGQDVEYVTVLMGANDACTRTETGETGMTEVATFREQFQAGLTTLSEGSPDAIVFVASVPNIYQLWNVLKDNGTARFVWNAANICQSMLANPTSTAQVDVDRRNRVRQRVVDFNTQLREVCAQFIHCRFDNNAIFNTVFAASDVSVYDYFHPSPAGQRLLANAAAPASFDWTDNVAPLSTHSVSIPNGTLAVALSATDNVAVSGIEYRLNGGNWTRYTAPITIVSASTLIYRAVDVNGNIEGEHTTRITPTRTFVPMLQGR